MHILYLHQYFTTPWISGGTRSYDFARRWVDKGHKVTVLTSSAFIGGSCSRNSNKGINFIKIDGLDVVVINVTYSQHMPYLRRVMAFLLFMICASVYLLKKNDFDLVFATSTPLTIAIPALVARLRNKVPFIFEVRDLWPEYPADFGIIKNRPAIMLLESFCRYIYRKACHIIAISNPMADRIISKYKVGKGKIDVVPIGSCNYMLKHLDNNRVKEYISRYELEGKFVIGYAGTIGYVNNLDSMLNIAKILKEHTDIVFIIVGDGKEKKRLQDEAVKCNLHNVKFTGRLNYFETINVIAAFNIAYISEKAFDTMGRRLINAQDTLSNKFFDYIMLGKPVLINARGEISKMIDKYKCGFYVDDNSCKSIKETILLIKDNKQLRDDMGSNSKRLAEELDRYGMADRLEEVFKRYVKN